MNHPYYDLIEKIKLINDKHKNSSVEIVLNRFPSNNKFIEVLRELKKVKRLKTLVIVGNVSIEELNYINQINQLEELGLVGEYDFDMLQTSVSYLNNLKYLTIATPSECISSVEIENMILQYPNLKEINYNGDKYEPKKVL